MSEMTYNDQWPQSIQTMHSLGKFSPVQKLPADFASKRTAAEGAFMIFRMRFGVGIESSNVSKGRSQPRISCLRPIQSKLQAYIHNSTW